MLVLIFTYLSFILTKVIVIFTVLFMIVSNLVSYLFSCVHQRMLRVHFQGIFSLKKISMRNENYLDLVVAIIEVQTKTTRLSVQNGRWECSEALALESATLNILLKNK